MVIDRVILKIYDSDKGSRGLHTKNDIISKISICHEIMTIIALTRISLQDPIKMLA